MCYAVLLQCKLIGKTQEACSVEYSLVRGKVKSAILCVYELVPEANRQCFCNFQKTFDKCPGCV